MYAQNMALRLERAAKMAWPQPNAAGDDDRIDRGIGKHLFHIVDRGGHHAVPLQVLQSRDRAEIEAQLMAAGFGQAAHHIETVGMIAQECETHIGSF